MDRAPFSAFLLLLVGIILLAQFVTGNLWTFVDGLLGTNKPAAAGTAPTGTGTSSTGGGSTSGRLTTYAGSSRSG